MGELCVKTFSNLILYTAMLKLEHVCKFQVVAPLKWGDQLQDVFICEAPVCWEM